MCRAWLMTVVSFRQFYMAASDTDSSCKKESIFDWDLLSIGHYQYVPPPHFMYRMSAIPPSPSDSILSSAERRVRENLISINKCIRAPPKSISILYCRRLLILLILRCISGKKRRYIHYILDYEWWECEVGYVNSRWRFSQISKSSSGKLLSSMGNWDCKHDKLS